jgi:hypothetical protein
MPSAPAGQAVTHLGSPHWRHIASSNPKAVGMTWMRALAISSAPVLADAQALMHFKQPSHLAASKAMVA